MRRPTVIFVVFLIIQCELVMTDGFDPSILFQFFPLIIDALQNLPTLPPLDLDPKTTTLRPKILRGQRQDDLIDGSSAAFSSSADGNPNWNGNEKTTTAVNEKSCTLATQLFKECLNRTDTDVLLCRDTVGLMTACVKAFGMPVLVNKRFSGRFYNSKVLPFGSCMHECKRDPRCYAVSYDSKKQLRSDASCFFLGANFNIEDSTDWRCWINPKKMI